MVEFETGSLSKEEIEAVLDLLPVDITFVDRDDSVKYFSKAKGRKMPPPEKRSRGEQNR